MRDQDTATTSDAAMRRISAQPFGLRRQQAVSCVAPPRRTAGSTPSSSLLGSGLLALATRLTRGCETSSQGFTLIELMIAVLLLVGGIAAATFIMSRGMFATTDTETVEQAVALAQERMENLRGTAFASIASEPKTPISGWTGFSRQVVVSQPAGTNSDFKQVAVTVYWNTADGEVSHSLTTYVANVVNN